MKVENPRYRIAFNLERYREMKDGENVNKKLKLCQSFAYPTNLCSVIKKKAWVMILRISKEPRGFGLMMRGLQ